MCQTQQLRAVIADLQRILTWIEWAIANSPAEFQTDEVKALRQQKHQSLLLKMREYQARLCKQLNEDSEFMYTAQLLYRAGVPCSIDENLIIIHPETSNHVHS